MMIDVNDNEIAIEKRPTIGERLSHARQAKNLTTADIAMELRLTKQTIEFIEREQWNELHGRAYARGYFSNYVKFLGLPEDEFLTAFNEEYRAVEPSLLSVGTRQQIETGNKNVLWLPSLLFITIAVISWFAYQQIQNKAEDVVVEDVSSLLPNTQSNDVASNEDTSIKYGVVTPNIQLETNELNPLVKSETESLVNNEQLGDTSTDNSEIVTNNELDTIALERIVQESNDNELISENTTTALANSALDLRFSGDCWVEVKDADNKVLLKKLMVKDDSIILRGRTPLTVMLGRASVAQVRFNDELFDYSASTHKGVARFTLGAES